MRSRETPSMPAKILTAHLDARHISQTGVELSTLCQSTKT
jgi:hypothetical protein